MISKLINRRIFLQKLQASGINRQYSEGLPPNLRRAYEKFQRDDGVPVYLKGGAGDRVLFAITVVLVAGGVANGLYSLARLDRKK